MASSLNGTGITFSDGTTQASGFTQSSAASGWTKLPNGLILQWGRTALASGSNSSSYYVTTTFPIAFPNGCYQVIGGGYGPTELNTAVSGNVISYTNSNFVYVVNRYGGANPLVYMNYIAIGY